MIKLTLNFTYVIYIYIAWNSIQTIYEGDGITEIEILTGEVYKVKESAEYIIELRDAMGRKETGH